MLKATGSSSCGRRIHADVGRNAVPAPRNWLYEVDCIFKQMIKSESMCRAIPERTKILLCEPHESNVASS